VRRAHRLQPPALDNSRAAYGAPYGRFAQPNAPKFSRRATTSATSYLWCIASVARQLQWRLSWPACGRLSGQTERSFVTAAGRPEGRVAASKSPSHRRIAATSFERLPTSPVGGASAPRGCASSQNPIAPKLNGRASSGATIQFWCIF